MSAVALDVAAVRARFSALDRPLAFLDAPGGTQTPDSVIEAMASYLRESNANLGGPFETSVRSDALIVTAHHTAARFLGCEADEVGFGQNMTTLNFALTRTLGRELRAGDEIVVTRLDHDGNISPWLELAHDLDLVVRFVDIREEDVTLDLDDLERQLGDRTRVVAFPWASNAVGTITDVRRIVELAHEAGALAWVDAVHYGPHGPIDVRAVDADVLLCSPYKFFGPHLGLFYGRRELIERWRPYKVRPAPERADRRALRDRDAPARGARGLLRGRRLHRVAGLGGDHRPRARAGRALPRRPPGRASGSTARRRWRAASRPSRSPSPASLRRRPLLVWPSVTSPPGGATTTPTR